MNVFVSKISDKCKPFFNSIGQSMSLIWGEEQSKALKKINKYTSIAPNLVAPIEVEDLCLNLDVPDVAVSATLVRAEDKN